ncbi:hypothetical protein Tco_0627841 [Tanacetum coccineum]|uniref:Zinc finger, CCHC-type n=1 Tax=Tanacetum coccineum TaxID=301880 RepID=A0ABQ4WNK7_9ASTR
MKSGSSNTELRADRLYSASLWRPKWRVRELLSPLVSLNLRVAFHAITLVALPPCPTCLPLVRPSVIKWELLTGQHVAPSIYCQRTTAWVKVISKRLLESCHDMEPEIQRTMKTSAMNNNMHSRGKTVNELHAMLKLHEQTLPKNNAPALHVIRTGHWKGTVLFSTKPEFAIKKKKNASLWSWWWVQGFEKMPFLVCLGKMQENSYTHQVERAQRSHPKETMGAVFFTPHPEKLTRRPTRSYAFYYNDAEEHKLAGDLGEPTRVWIWFLNFLLMAETVVARVVLRPKDTNMDGAVYTPIKLVLVAKAILKTPGIDL